MMWLAILLTLVGCKDDPELVPNGEKKWECQLDPNAEAPPYSPQLGCLEDFEILASAPLDASIPGAQSAKTVLDRTGTAVYDDPDGGWPLYFQNSKEYQIHWEFAFNNLSGNGNPLVPDLGGFNLTEYYSPDRRFILGAVTWYAEPEVWAYEIAPYDTADATMIAEGYRAVRDNAYFGDDLYFHPTSLAVEGVAADLPPDVKIITTDELFEGVNYQPLNLGLTMGLLTFYTADEVDGAYVNFRELVVLDAIPNDIAITAGIITDEFQTPLSHINVLSQNRGTPNMALRDAWNNQTLRDLEGKWVELIVEPFDWYIREVTAEEAEAWWQKNKPEPLEAVPMDLSVTELTDEWDILDLDTYELGEAISVAIPAFGGKAGHYGGLAIIGDEVPHPRAFAIPMYWYDQFMTINGFYDEMEAMMADKTFMNDPPARGEMLEAFQADMELGEMPPGLVDMVTEKLETEFPDTRMRFRSSTNAEDLGSFTGAGLYTSKSGELADPEKPIDLAMRQVWASVWNPRAYEERAYYSIDHLKVGMALLVHRSFPDEEANGVAITANIFDTSGLEPAFYVNVQDGGESVVLPDPGVISDQFIYYFDLPGQPITYIAHSNLIPEGETVLTVSQTYELGVALAAIRDFFYPVYGVGGGFYGMDTEFKFDGEPGEEPTLYMKQARPYPGWE